MYIVPVTNICKWGHKEITLVWMTRRAKPHLRKEHGDNIVDARCCVGHGPVAESGFTIGSFIWLSPPNPLSFCTIIPSLVLMRTENRLEAIRLIGCIPFSNGRTTSLRCTLISLETGCPRRSYVSVLSSSKRTFETKLEAHWLFPWWETKKLSQGNPFLDSPSQCGLLLSVGKSAQFLGPINLKLSSQGLRI